ncbi:MAG: hypothetical protein JJLCMIEE_01186 [Acidimicrobiales bacterium]|nr:hypothetical protein [Acidimicrobiales bacterium]
MTVYLPTRRQGRRSSPTPRWPAPPLTIVLVLALLLAACSDGNSADGDTPDTTIDPYPLDDELRLNDIQVLGSHNSYHVQPEDELFDVMAAVTSIATVLEYTHVPLDEQLSEQGIRQMEIDVYADPEGGLYHQRAAPELLGLDSATGPEELLEPGFKVLHYQDLDFLSTCLTLVECLRTVKQWSDANPLHVPIMITIEPKDDVIDIIEQFVDLTEPVEFTAALLDDLDAEIRSVFDEQDLITPDDVRGEFPTLEEAVTTEGWPTLGESRGKVLFTMTDTGEAKEAYLDGHPTLEGRVMFTDSGPGEPAGAFVRVDDPLGDGERITELVEQGFLVLTRTDADTAEARADDTTRREAALSSGAQFVSTDYPVPDDDLGNDYFVEIPGGVPARCNPLIAPPDCEPDDIENPEYLR